MNKSTSDISQYGGGHKFEQSITPMEEFIKRQIDDINGQPPIRIIVAGDDVQFKEFLESYVEFLDLAPDNDSY